jgi:hypothetical protein
MAYRTVMLAVVPDAEPGAAARWINLDAAQPACVTYLQKRRDATPEELPERWRRTEEIFAAHIPAAHHLIRVDITTLPPSAFHRK